MRGSWRETTGVNGSRQWFLHVCFPPCGIQPNPHSTLLLALKQGLFPQKVQHGSRPKNPTTSLNVTLACFRVSRTSSSHQRTMKINRVTKLQETLVSNPTKYSITCRRGHEFLLRELMMSFTNRPELRCQQLSMAPQS